jgi:hypothetical protein
MKGRNKQKDALFHVAVNSCVCKCWRYTNKVSIWLTDQMIETRENQTETPGENLLRMSVCSQQIPHKLVWFQTWVFGVEAGDRKEENIWSCGRRCEDNCKMHLTVGARVLVLLVWINIRSSGMSLRTRQWAFLIEVGSVSVVYLLPLFYFAQMIYAVLYFVLCNFALFLWNLLNICRLLLFL